jgi:hypothetical protein
MESGVLKDSGITYYEDDRGKGPFIIRIGGTSKFVSNIQTGYYSRWGSPAKKVTLVEGWNNPSIRSYQTMDEEIEAAAQVRDIEGFYMSVETVS